MSAEEPTQAPVVAEEKKGGPSRAEVKEARKAERLAAEAAAKAAKAEALSSFQHIFGNKPLIQSQAVTSPEEKAAQRWRSIANITDADIGTTVTIRARVHASRKKGKMAFLVLRQVPYSIQAIVASTETIPAEMATFAGSLALESIVEVTAVVVQPPKPVEGTTSKFELNLKTLHAVSNSLPVLPFPIEDASRRDDSELPTVQFDTRLATRWLDMRTKASNAIFRIQSRVCQYFREFLLAEDFTEIHSPKLIGTASEGGANVFKLDYFGRPACLAQSPQLYKQMALQGDLERVFEVAPVFRAENSNTHRHLCEFVGLDVEMVIHEHYYEVLDVAEGLFAHIFNRLGKETVLLESVNEQYPFSPFVHQVSDEKLKELGVGVIEEALAPTDQYGALVRNRTVRMLRIPFARAIAMLNDKYGLGLSEVDDINTENERRLGALVKERYGVDFYISDRYPLTVRPFYTMPCPDDARFSNSYDMFIRGEEIVSGAQRVHDPAMLESRARSLGIDPATLKDYIDSFRLGAWPHGGFGVGLERVVMLYLGLKNIRLASMYPRDPQRIHP